MDDLISRQALLDDIEELKKSHWFNDDNYFAIRKDALSCVVDLCIKKAPSAQQWIPCSERLPNYDEEVLVDYHGKVRLASLTKNDEEYPWYFIVNRFNAKLETVRAWMPLPEPYREEKTNET